jgi:hypothetical protein
MHGAKVKIVNNRLYSKTKLPYADAVHCDRPSSTQEQFLTELHQQQLPRELMQTSVCQVVCNASNV